VNQGSVPTTLAALSHHNTLIKEALQSPFALDPLTFTYQKVSIPTLADRSFLANWLPAFTRKAKMTLLFSTLYTGSVNLSLEVALMRTRVVFDDDLQRYHPTCIALERFEDVNIVGIAMSGNLVSGKRLQA
jgi:hypothetical protein